MLGTFGETWTRDSLSEESQVWRLSRISGGMPSYTVLFLAVA